MAGRARTAAASAPGAPGTAVAPAASATAPGRVLAVQFLHEQTPGSGEDAEPLLTTLGTDAALLAVFDGLGGAGSETVGTAGGPRSGAYLASRLAGEVVERCSYVLRATAATGELPGKPAQRALGADFARRLETDLHLEFSRAAQQLGSPRTRLRSTLFKTLPTTLVAAHCLYDAAAGAGQVEVYWAGDSRAFLLSPTEGLHQLTHDDLRSGGDALANLSEDSPVSNCVSADAPFVIHYATAAFEGPHVVLVATDGCFGFVSTPAHFEHLLLDALDRARSLGGWRANLEAAVQAIAGDDASMAAVALGWDDVAELRRDFRPRHALVAERFVDPLAGRDERLAELRASLASEQAARDELRLRLWEEYRASYESLMPPARSGS